MVELFNGELPKSAEQNSMAASAQDCSQKCFQDILSLSQSQKSAGRDLVTVKDVPGASIEAENNQFYFNYRGLHMPTWTEKNPDDSAAKPYVDVNGKARVEGKLQALTDDQGKVLGADGKPLLDANGMRRYTNDGAPVPTKFDSSDPLEMKKALEGQDKPLSDESRAAYGKMIESADKLDRVDMARTIESNEKFVMSHTTAFLWENGYRRTQKQLNELRHDLDLSPSQSKMAEYQKKVEELKAKDDELKEKPVLAEHVKKMRAANASDEECGRLLESSADSRSSYLSKLLAQDDVKKYMTAADKSSAESKALENTPDIKDAKRMVQELSKINPELVNQLKPTAQALGLSDFARRNRKN